MFCPSCGKSNPSGAKFCNGCGMALPALTTSVRCPFCGADGQEYQFNCTKCGKELPTSKKTGPLTSKVCPTCGRPMSIYDSECPYCRAPAAIPEYYSGDSTHSESTALPVAGGALILVAGVLGIVQGALALAAIADIQEQGDYVGGSVTCCALLMGLFGLIALFGGITAIQRKSLVLSIVGGVFGILCLGFFLGAVLSFVGLILVAVAYREFKD